jgi:hypothetical protein
MLADWLTDSWLSALGCTIEQSISAILGSINVDTFLAKVMSRKTVRRNQEMDSAARQVQGQVSQLQRRKRIEQKSMQFKKLAEISTMLHDCVKGVMDSLQLTAKQLFRRIDEDDGGTIDMDEFRHFLTDQGEWAICRLNRLARQG